MAVREIGNGCLLFPEEEACVSGAVTSRRAEFSTGRQCARDALAAIGVNPCAIPVGRRHEPLWPIGIVGTITHAAGLCAAVVGRAGRWQGIGVDIVAASTAAELLRDAGSLVGTEREIAAARLATPPGVDPLALLFSAKESAVKAISAQFQRFLDFTEIELSLGGECFEASCRGLAHPVRGRWTVTGGLIATGASFGPDLPDTQARKPCL